MLYFFARYRVAPRLPAKSRSITLNVYRFNFYSFYIYNQQPQFDVR